MQSSGYKLGVWFKRNDDVTEAAVTRARSDRVTMGFSFTVSCYCLRKPKIERFL